MTNFSEYVSFIWSIAEILRGSYWAEGSSLEEVNKVVRNVSARMNNEQVIELMGLVRKAISYQARDD